MEERHLKKGRVLCQTVVGCSTILLQVIETVWCQQQRSPL